MMETFGFDRGPFVEYLDNVDSAVRVVLAPDERLGVLIGGASASGAAVAKRMLRSGAVLFTDRYVRVWHRDALMGEAGPEHELGIVAASDVARLEIPDRDTAPLRLVDGEGNEVLAIHYRGDDRDAVIEVLRQWADEVGHHTADVAAETFSGRARKAGSSAVGFARDRTRDTFDTLTLREYRDEVETVLAQVVEVLTAHEAEIVRLREREDELTTRLAELERTRAVHP